MRFVALDFETANADLSSICQVGLAVFEDRQLTISYNKLVNPGDYFDPIHTSIHGIDDIKTRNSPMFPEIYEEILAILGTEIVACHTFFDRTAAIRATSRAQLKPFACRWLDTASVARRTWPQFARSGYGLANVAKEFGISFRHHDAAEDARATGEVLLLALQASGMSLEEAYRRSYQPLTEPSAYRERIVQAGDPNGPFSGQVIVFTGSLSVPRREASDHASRLGCEVANGVTKETTILVVGDQDVRRLSPGKTKSSKHLRAEELIALGQALRIVTESDWLELSRTAAE